VHSHEIPEDEGDPSRERCTRCNAVLEESQIGLCGDCQSEDKCRKCGEPNNDGEGFDGLCGNCADVAERKRGTNG